jgi:hypothetical protein
LLIRTCLFCQEALEPPQQLLTAVRSGFPNPLFLVSGNHDFVMTTDIVALIEFYEKEKDIERERVVEALQYAFCSAYRKMVPGADAIEILRTDINEKKGDTRIFASLEVVADDDYVDKFNEVPLAVAAKKEAGAVIGDRVDFDITPKNFGRIAVQTAKQTMMQRLRQAEKEKIYDEFKDRAGDIVSGSVRRFEKSDVMVDLGRFEARMPSKERVGTEEYNVGDRIRCYVVSCAVSSNQKWLRFPIAPLNSGRWLARPATALKWLFILTMTKLIQWAPV